MRAHAAPAGARAVLAGLVLVGMLSGFSFPGQAQPLGTATLGPALAFSTYLGGRWPDWAIAVAVDPAGAAYVVGRTTAGAPVVEFPRTGRRIGSDQASIVVAKLDPTGQQLVWVTLVGGSDYDEATDVAVGADGSVYVTGRTYSADFPVMNAYQPDCGSCVPDPTIESDAFLFKLRSDGSGLVYSTFVGGTGFDYGTAVVIDTIGRASIAGWTTVAAPTCSGSEAFVRTFSEDGAALVRSLTLGGPCGDQATGLAIDGASNLYVPIRNDLGDFPLVNPIVPAPGGTMTVLAKITAAGDVAYATPLPVFAGDAHVAVFDDGRVVVAGESYVAPAAPTARRLGPLGRADLVMVGLDAAATAFTEPLYVGGSDDERFRDLAVDASGTTWIVGASWSADFPWASPVQPLATQAIFMSSDGGEWFDPISIPGLGGGATCFAAGPGGAVVVAGTRLHGVFRSADRGRTWAPANHGLEGLEVTSVAVSAKVPSTLYAAASGAVYRSVDDGASWLPVSHGPGGIPEFVETVGVSAIDPATAFAGTVTGIYVSRDGGTTWRISMIGMPLPTQIRTIVTNPALPSHVFVGTPSGVYVSGDDGRRWVPATAGVPAYMTNVRGLVIDPLSPPTLYGLFAYLDGSAAVIYRSGNLGVSWVPLASQPEGVGLSYVGLTLLALGPGTPAVLFAGGQSVARSTDGGASWVRVGGGLRGLRAVEALDARTVLVGRDPPSDGLLVGVDLAAGTMVHASPIGGGSDDLLAGVATGTQGDVLVAGWTMSSDVPTANAIQPFPGGANEMLLARISTGVDTDTDGLPDAWEWQVGLTVGVDDAGDDPDGDGATNLEEAEQGTHPRGFHATFLAEGATGPFFETEIALVNPDPSVTAHVWLGFDDATGRRTGQPLLVPPLGRRTVDVASVPALRKAEFGTVVESDIPVAASRMMRWDATGYGAHAGQAVAASSRWYFAEGATTAGFELFYLLFNPHDGWVHVDVTWLPSGRAPIDEDYLVAPHSRLTIWVNYVPGLATSEVGATFATDAAMPIVVERAMYLDAGGQRFGAGHAGAGVAEPGLEWFAAEGATGPFFDLFLLFANPMVVDAVVEVRYLRPVGVPIVKRYVVPARSRYTIWVDQEDPALADTAVSTEATSVNGVPLVMERAMWWPGPTAQTWYEAHVAPGTRDTGTLWAVPDGLIRGTGDAATYVLIANPGADEGAAEVTLVFEDGSRARIIAAVPPASRLNVSVRDEAWTFESAADESAFRMGGRFGVLVESVGPAVPLVVESAVYWDAPDAHRVIRSWAAGTSTGAVKVR